MLKFTVRRRFIFCQKCKKKKIVLAAGAAALFASAFVAQNSGYYLTLATVRCNDAAKAPHAYQVELRILLANNASLFVTIAHGYLEI